MRNFSNPLEVALCYRHASLKALHRARVLSRQRVWRCSHWTALMLALRAVHRLIQNMSQHIFGFNYIFCVLSLFVTYEMCALTNNIQNIVRLQTRLALKELRNEMSNHIFIVIFNSNFNLCLKSNKWKKILNRVIAIVTGMKSASIVARIQFLKGHCPQGKTNKTFLFNFSENRETTVFPTDTPCRKCVTP